MLLASYDVCSHHIASAVFVCCKCITDSVLQFSIGAVQTVSYVNYIVLFYCYIECPLLSKLTSINGNKQLDFDRITKLRREYPHVLIRCGKLKQSYSRWLYTRLQALLA